MRTAVSLPAQHISSRAPAEPEPDLDVSIVPGARQRKRAMMMTAGAVAGFVLLGVMALMSSSAPPVPAPKVEAKPEPAAPAPIVPSTAPATLPAPTTPEPAAIPAQPQLAQNTQAPAPAATPPEPSAAPAPPPAAQAPSAAANIAALAGPAAVPAAAPAANPVEPDVVRIQLRATPPEAELVLDDKRITNPYDNRAPKGGKHLLRVESDGYRGREITLRFDHDREITVELEKKKAPKASHQTHVAPPPPAPVAHVAKPRSPATEAKVQPAAPRTKKGAGFVSESPY